MHCWCTDALLVGDHELVGQQSAHESRQLRSTLEHEVTRLQE